MGFRGWLTKNASNVIEKTVEQGKQTLATNVGNKTDLYYKVGRLALLALLTWLAGKEASGYLGDGTNANNNSLPSPSNITVNNYIFDKEDKERSSK